MFASKDIFLKSSGGYQISRSVRLRSSASAYFNKTLTTPTNNKIWTYSVWVKKARPTSNYDSLFSVSDSKVFRFGYSGSDFILNFIDTNTGWYFTTTQVFRDPSAWMHLVLVIDTTDATAGNRTKVYVNGIQVTAFSAKTDPSQNAASSFNTTVAHYIGQAPASGHYFDGYMTEINFIDGQALTPSSFGETNAVTGVWQPKKYGGTYGNNGFYLNFSDNSNNTATTIGKDYSGNGNNWTPNNISVTAGVTYDSFTDVPTPYADGGTGRGNYAVGNPLAVNVTTNATATLTNGNLLLTNGSANYSGFPITMSIPVTGKWAWKFKVTGTVSGSNDGYIGFACNSSGNPVTGASSGAAANWFTTVQVQAVSDRGVVHKYAGGSVVTDAAGSGGTGATGDEWEFLIDRDAGTTIVKINGTTKATVTGLPATQELFPFATFYQTSGYFIFDYTPSDTSYKTLNTQNLPTPTISNGAGYMDAKLWTGNGTSQTITGFNFQPDFAWIKSRSIGYQHSVYDAVRTTSAGRLATDQTLAETSNGANDPSFTSNGITVRAVLNDNGSGQTFVGWMWNAGGSTVTNTSGTISAQVRANTTAGFSVVTYTGTGANATVGHGLGVAPSMLFVKRRNTTGNWMGWHTSLTGSGPYIILNSTNAVATGAWNNTNPTSTLFSLLGSDTDENANGSTYVAYVWAAVAGYSAFGKYTGNGSTDGPFVFTNFRPRWVMIKRTDTAGENWEMWDSSRGAYNIDTPLLYANLSNAETAGSAARFDALSNGFKIRSTNAGVNASGGTYVYAAFCESPFKIALAR